jgi:hypothetical protein
MRVRGKNKSLLAPAALVVIDISGGSGFRRKVDPGSRRHQSQPGYFLGSEGFWNPRKVWIHR